MYKNGKTIYLKHGQDLEGLTDFTVKHEVAKYGALYLAQDQQLKAAKNPINGFYTICYEGRLRPFFLVNVL